VIEHRRIGDTPQGGPVQSFYVPKGTARRPAIARGEGIYLWDVDGRRCTWLGQRARGRPEGPPAGAPGSGVPAGELETWERDAQADRDRVEQLRERWGSWQGALDEDPVLARQLLKKVLGTPIYVRPTGHREWIYVGIGRYDWLLKGAVAAWGGSSRLQAAQEPHRGAHDVPDEPRGEPRRGRPGGCANRWRERRSPGWVQDAECQLGARYVTARLAKRHGFAGVLRVGGMGGHFGAPHD
jgi:hypothetical protein